MKTEEQGWDFCEFQLSYHIWRPQEKDRLVTFVLTTIPKRSVHVHAWRQRLRVKVVYFCKPKVWPEIRVGNICCFSLWPLFIPSAHRFIIRTRRDLSATVVIDWRLFTSPVHHERWSQGFLSHLIIINFGRDKTGHNSWTYANNNFSAYRQRAAHHKYSYMSISLHQRIILHSTSPHTSPRLMYRLGQIRACPVIFPPAF